MRLDGVLGGNSGRNSWDFKMGSLKIFDDFIRREGASGGGSGGGSGGVSGGVSGGGPGGDSDGSSGDVEDRTRGFQLLACAQSSLSEAQIDDNA